MEKSAKEIAFDRALAMLKASGVKFAIITESGQEITHGDISIVQRVEKKRVVRKDRPVGALVNHYGPYLKKMKPGDVSLIPFGSFKPKELRAAMSAWSCHTWGSKSSITVTKENGIEILRVM